MAQRRCLTVGQSSGLDEKKQSTCASSEKHETHLPGESMRPLDLLVRLTHPSINQESPKCKTREKVIDFFGRAGGASARLQTVIDRIQGCKLRHLEDFAKVLDALMGKDRNKPLGERQGEPEKIDFLDPKHCPHFLIDFCPHELFVNTKSDIGPCSRLHDERVKAAFQDLSEEDQWKTGLHREMLRTCERLVEGMDERIKRQERRAGVEPEVGANLDDAGKAAQQEQLDAIESKITDLVDKMDKLAEEGEVDELDSVVSLMERFKQEKEELLRVGGERGAPKAMRVCDICGAYLVSSDSERRIQAHLEGKLHIGFYTLRTTIEKLATKSREYADLIEASAPRRRSRSRDRDRDRDRSSRRKRSRSRDRDRDRRSSRKHSDRASGSWRRSETETRTSRDSSRKRSRPRSPISTTTREPEKEKEKEDGEI